MVSSAVPLDAITDIAVAAGEATLKLYRSQDAWVRDKPDGSPVTEADIASEEMIQTRLRSLDPTIPYLSEESGPPPVDERLGWRRFWLVDPLDGTKEFIRRTDEFTVNIALIDEGEPVMGVVVAPALGLLYYAAKGQGAWRVRNGMPPERLESRLADPKKPLRIVESRSHPSPELEAFLEDYTVSDRLKIGSSLKFCLLAEGSADVYPRLGPTMEWDVGAGDCVYRHSANGSPHPSPLTYNKRSLLNDCFVLGLPLDSYTPHLVSLAGFALGPVVLRCSQHCRSPIMRFLHSARPAP